MLHEGRIHFNSAKKLTTNQGLLVTDSSNFVTGDTISTKTLDILIVIIIGFPKFTTTTATTTTTIFIIVTCIIK